MPYVYAAYFQYMLLFLVLAVNSDWLQIYRVIASGFPFGFCLAALEKNQIFSKAVRQNQNGKSGFEANGVRRSYSSRMFLCTLDSMCYIMNQKTILWYFNKNIQRSTQDLYDSCVQLILMIHMPLF